MSATETTISEAGLFRLLGPTWADKAPACCETGAAIRDAYAAHARALPADETIAHAAAMHVQYGDGAASWFWENVSHPTRICLLAFRHYAANMQPEGVAALALIAAGDAAHTAQWHEDQAASWERRAAAGGDHAEQFARSGRASRSCAADKRAEEAAHRARAAAASPALAMAAE